MRLQPLQNVFFWALLQHITLFFFFPLILGSVKGEAFVKCPTNCYIKNSFFCQFEIVIPVSKNVLYT